MKKKLLTLGLVLVLTITAAMPTFAASSESKDVDVTIDVKATDVDITVPTTLPVVFNADGRNTIPTDFKITNNSQIARIELTNASVNKENNGWKLTTEDTKTLVADSKDVKFFVGVDNNIKCNFTSINTDLAINRVIPATESATLCFEMERAAFTQPISVASAFNLVLDFEWAK